MASLIFINRNFSGQVYELTEGTTTVGRGPGNKLILHDETVSTRHCEILVNGPEVIIRDLGSRNGTFINLFRLNPQGQIKSGQTLRLGSLEARLDLGAVPEETAASEITAVHAHRRAMERQQRNAGQPEAGTAPRPMEPGSEPGSAGDGHTVLMPRPNSTPESPAAPSTGNAGGKRGVTKWVVLLVLLIIVVGVAVAWWLSRKHSSGT